MLLWLIIRSSLTLILLQCSWEVCGQCRSGIGLSQLDFFPTPQQMRGRAGAVSSPNFPNNFPLNQQCAWEIKPGRASNIQAYDTPENSRFWFVTGERSFGGDFQQVTPGTGVPPNRTFNTVTALGIVWETSGATSSGWSFVYEAVPLPDDPGTATVVATSEDTTLAMAVVAAAALIISIFGVGI